MSTEPTVPTVAETQNPAPEVAEETPEVAAPEAEATTDAGSEADSEEVKAEPNHEVRRLERELRKAQRNNAKLHQQIGTLSTRVDQTARPAQTDEPPSREVDVDALVDLRATAREFAKESKVIVDGGRKEFEDFEAVVLRDLVNEVGPLVDEDGLPTEFMATLREVQDSPEQQRKLLYYIGKDLDLASELAGLSKAKLAVRLDRIEREMADKSKPKPSSAPKPLTPVKPTATSSGLSDNLSDSEWEKRRNAELREMRR